MNDRDIDGEVAQLKAKHAAELQSLRDEFDVRESSWQERLDKIKESIVAMRAALDEQQRDVNERDRAITELAAKLESNAQQVATLEEYLEARDREVTTLHKNLEARTNEIAAQQKAIEARDQALASLQASLDTSHREIASLREQIDALRQQETKLISDLQMNAKEVDALRGQLESRDSEVESLKAHLTSVATDLRTLTETQRDIGNVLDAERQTGWRNGLDERLAAIEELTRSTADQVGELSERASTARDATEQEISTVTKHLAGLAGAQRKSVLALSRRQTWRHVETAAILLAVIVGIAVIAVITRNPQRGRAKFGATAVATTSGSETPPAAGRDADSTSPPLSVATNSSTMPITKPEPDIESEPDTEPTKLDTPGGSAEAAVPRKELRRALFDAVAHKRWAAAADAGLQMRGSYEIDWEAALVLADALTRARRYEDAVAVYREFLESFPTNHYADKALFRLAECLQATKRHREARTAYERLAQKPGKYRKRAKKALAGLRGADR